LKISDFDPKEILKIAGIYAACSFFFWLFGFYSFVKIINGEGLAPFRLGKLPVPNFIHSSNIEVLIFCAVAAVALAVGFYIRYVKYGEELHFRNKYGIPDDRKFSDDFTDGDSFDGD